MFRRRTPLTLLQRLRLLAWPSRSWARSARYVYLRLIRLKATPHKVAFGFACGAFMATTPLIGFQILIAGVMAVLGQGSILAAALGTFVGNPATFPVFWIGSYQLGSVILGENQSFDVGLWGEGRDLGFLESLRTLSIEPLHRAVETLWPIFKPMLVGSLPIGLLVAAACYVVVYQLMSLRQGRDGLRLPSLLGRDRFTSDEDSIYFPAGLPTMT